MGDKVELTLEERSAVGRAVKALREQGFVPAVVYGKDFKTATVMASSIAMGKVYREAGKHHPIELNLGTQKKLAMIKSADIDPVKRTLRHVEFHIIKQNEKVATEVPVVITGAGETPAEKAGLVVLTTLESVEIEALPSNLPDELAAPGDKLAEVGDHLIVADLQVPKGVTVTVEPERVIATVYEPSALQAANEAAGGDAVAGDESEVPAEEGEEAPAEGEETAGKEKKKEE